MPDGRTPMRASFLVLAVAGLLSLSACGGGGQERTVVVNPPASGQTVVVPPEGAVRQCPYGQSVC